MSGDLVNEQQANDRDDSRKAGPALPTGTDLEVSVNSLPPPPMRVPAPPLPELTIKERTAVREQVPPPDIPGYEILGELGHGGMGVVFKARQLSLNRIVALKMILAGAHARPEELVRFLAEAEAVASLEHPHIVRIHEISKHKGQPYFSLEYLDGGSLDRKLAKTPQPARQAAALVETLARTMHAVHAKNIIHRDLKPGNVLLSADGVPKITDFGLAKRLVGGGAGLTPTQAVLGTPNYMAPEQAGSESAAGAVGPAADIHALGAILYEMLTGRPPFLGVTWLETVEQVLHTDPVPPARLQPGVPRDLETICLKCLNKQPSRRYASALDLADDLRRFQEGKPILARPVGPLARAEKWVRRNPARVAIILSLILVVLGFGLWQRAERNRRHQRTRNLEKQVRENETDQKFLATFLDDGKLKEVEGVLSRALKRLKDEDEPALVEQRLQFDAMRERMRRLVGFYRHSEEGWFRTGEERFEEAQVASETALQHLGILTGQGSVVPDWTKKLPVQDIPYKQRRQLFEEVYRQLLLLTYVRSTKGLVNLNAGVLFGLKNPEANAAFRSALDALEQARVWEKSQPLKAAQTVRLFNSFLDDLIRQTGGPAPKTPPVKDSSPGRVEPADAVDYFFTGSIHYFYGKSVKNDAVKEQIFRSWNKLLDTQTPLATAEEQLRESTRRDPGRYWPHFILGRILMNFKKYREAVQVFNTCVVIDPDFAVSYQLRGLANVHQALPMRAREFAGVGSSVLAGGTGPLLPATALTVLGRNQWSVLRQSGKYVERGMGDADKAWKLAQAKDESAILWTRGEMFFLLNQVPQGLESFALGLEKDEQLLKRIFRRNVLEMVKKHVAGVLRAEPGNADAHAVLAWVEFREGKAKQAAVRARRALDVNPHQARARALLAILEKSLH